MFPISSYSLDDSESQRQLMKEAKNWGAEKALLQKKHHLKHWKKTKARDAYDYDPNTVSPHDDASNINGG